MRAQKACGVLVANQETPNRKRTVHPIWAGVGAAGGALAGAAIGAVAGPVGAVLGLVACAFVGGLAGKNVAEKNDPAIDEAVWQVSYSARCLVIDPIAQDVQRPAYRILYERYTRDHGRKYLEVQNGFGSRLREAQTFQSNLG